MCTTENFILLCIIHTYFVHPPLPDPHTPKSTISFKRKSGTKVTATSASILKLPVFQHFAYLTEGADSTRLTGVISVDRCAETRVPLQWHNQLRQNLEEGLLENQAWSVMLT